MAIAAEGYTDAPSTVEPLPCQRHLFQLPEDAVWLNCASRAPMLRETERVGHLMVSAKNEPWRISDDGVHERCRALFAQLLGVSPDTIALTPSTSYALSQVAHNLLRLGCVQPGEVALVLEDQMSSNVYPWQRLCREADAQLIAVPAPADGRWTEAIEASWQAVQRRGKRVALVAVPHYLWTDGSGPVDLERLGSLCSAEARNGASGGRRAVLVVDATQSLGVVPIDVQRCRVDWLACSVHKWLFGPYGLSFLYAAEEWCNTPRSEPLVQDEHNRLGADGDKVLPFDLAKPGYPEEMMAGARRFDSGGRPNPILLPMIETALKQILEWRPERISATVIPLMDRLLAGARALGLSVPPFCAPHIVGVGPGGEDLDALLAPGQQEDVARREAKEKWADMAAAYLKARRIFVSSRGGTLRTAIHVFNRAADVDAFLAAMNEFVRTHRGKAAAL